MIPDNLPHQFLCYVRTAEGQKFPCNARGEAVDAHDPRNWMTYDQAAAAAAALGPQFGVAFDLTENDPWFFIDLDKCFDVASGQWKPEALAIWSQFTGAWGEVSSSGTGLHIMGYCQPAAVAHLRNKWDGWKEFYVQGRFIAFGHTGWSRIGDVAVDYDWTEVIKTIVPERVNLGELPVGVDPRWTGPEDDDTLIEMALRSASHSAGAMFSGKATFADLWQRNVPVLARNFPHHSGDPGLFDWSSADSALLSQLAFWTGRDMPRMDRLFRRSGLMREKYAMRDDYRTNSVQNAARLVRSVYDKPRSVPAANSVPTAAGEARGEILLSIVEQIEHFKGCVYVRDTHRVLVPGGRMLKPEQFNATYGGHVFQMQPDGTGPTKKAFEAFTENRGWKFPSAIRPCFRPDLAPGVITDDGSVNTYYPPNVDMTPGDVTRFMDFLRKLLPDERDRAILIAYLAAVVQHPGVKFQWAPVLQGCEGNGKTLVFSTLLYAVGKQYTHQPRAEQITEKFNAYLEGKVFILIEEIHMEGRREVLDTLKPLITNVDVELRGMQQDQRMVENRANFGFCTNFKNAVVKSRNDRRYAIFYTAQQEVDDLARDGMTGDYFPSMYRWLREQGGYAAIANWLKTYAIPDELNPAMNCHRAPRTSSTDEAVLNTTGAIELEIMEAAQDNTRGFRDGWISTWALDALLRARGSRVARNTLGTILRQCGYVEWGRAPRPILQEDGKRPVLYRLKSAEGAGSFEEYLAAQAYLTQ